MSTIYDIPRQEAHLLTSTGSCQLLFSVPRTLLCDELYIGTTTAQPFNLSDGTEAIYPASIDGVTIENSGRLWNFAGGCTHCSELIFTPYDWAIGDAIVCQNQFNYMDIISKVVAISMIRDLISNSWYWLITLQSSK